MELLHDMLGFKKKRKEGGEEEVQCLQNYSFLGNGKREPNIILSSECNRTVVTLKTDLLSNFLKLINKPGFKYI